MSENSPGSAAAASSVALLSTPAEALPRSQRGFWSQFRRLPNAWIGGVLVVLVLGCAIFAPLIAPADPLQQFRNGLNDVGMPLPPGGQFPLGTDHLGRDMLSRLVYGARISLFVAFIANVFATLVGTTAGLLAGYFAGRADWLIMRVVDVLLAFPAVLLALAFGAVLRPSVTTVVIIVTLISWAPLARLVRSQVLTVRERDYITSAHCIGMHHSGILLYYVLPQVLSVVIVWTALSFASTVLVESALSFLGVGIPLPDASWGNMILEGQTRYRIAPWMIIMPTIAILLTTLGFNLLGYAARDALDPRTAQRL